MQPTRAIPILIAFILSLNAPAAPRAGDEAARLAGRALGETPLLDDLRDLCDHVGGRPTGSPSCERAMEWAAARFRAAGFDSVVQESFRVPALWLPGREEAECLAPERFPIRVAGAPYAPPTPGGRPIEGRVLDAGAGAPEDFARLGPDARGALALVRSAQMATLSDLFTEYMRSAPMLEAARQAGVSGLLLMSTRPRGLLYRHPVTLNATMAPMPVAMVSREHASRLARLIEKGVVRARLALDSRVGGAYESRNVVAEIRGREKPEEIVLMGAHLDSWDLGTGALDNGVNAALVIDAARGMKELGLVPRRTIRFVLFTGEEQGLWGSAGYVSRHASEMDRHVAVVIHDIGSGRITGFYLNGREELRGPVSEALLPVEGLGPFNHPDEAIDGTDNLDFLLSGVPNLVAAQDAEPYLPDYHAESDVLERVDARQARINAAIASALVWSLADSPARAAARQTRGEVEKLVRDSGLEGQMKAFGQWEDFMAGRRGASR
ncbi:MAG TPA: M28 family peptidase [Candidatus Polarisedimenticolia bacterium]|jgi:hypothetical protein